MKLLVNSQDKIYLTSSTKILKAKENCGMTIGDFIGNIDSNGVLQATGNIIPDFAGVEDINDYSLYYKFAYIGNKVNNIEFPDLTEISGNYAMTYMCFNNTNVKTVSFPELVTVSGQYTMSNSFQSSGLTSIELPKLTTISGNYGCAYAFSSMSSLLSASFPKLSVVSGNYGAQYICNNNLNMTSVSFLELTTITGTNGFMRALSGCSKLTSITFPKLANASGNSALIAFCHSNTLLQTASFPMLSDISGGGTFSQAFYACQNLTDIYFNALTTTSFGSYINQFNGMFNSTSMSTSGNCTIHFPSNLSSTISGLTGYPNFGGNASRVTIAFDLPATS